MKFDANAKAKTAFVLLLLVSMAAGAIWYFRSLADYATYQITTRDSVSGLIVDAPVEFHGVEVGKVKSILLVNPHSVKIVMHIDKTAPITSASIATITSRGLATRGFAGYVFIAIEDSGGAARPLVAQSSEPYPAIAIAPSKILTIDTALSQVNDNMQIITDLLQSTLDKKTIISLKESADNLRQVTDALARNTNKLNTIVDNSEHASRRLAPLLNSSQDALRLLQTQTLPQAHKALSNLDTLLDASNETLGTLQTQVLPKTQKVLSDLDGLSGSMSGTVNKIKQDPSILIRGTTPQPLGPGEEK